MQKMIRLNYPGNNYHLLVVVLTTVMGAILIALLASVSRSVTGLYQHPFVVSNAARQGQIFITKRQLIINDLLHRYEPGKEELIWDSILKQDYDIYNHLLTIEHLFLGNKDLIRQIFDECVQLRLTHRKTLDLIQVGHLDEAIRNEQEEGLVHASRLEDLIGEVILFAEHKAETFYQEAYTKSEYAIAASVLLVVLVILISGLLMRRQAGKFAQLLAASQRSEESLRRSNALLETLFETSHLAMAFLDRQFNFIRVNRAYANSCGQEVEFFVGKNHFDLYPHPENERIFREVVKSGTPFTIRAKPFTFPDHPEWGTTYWDWTLSPVFDAQGELEWLSFMLLDVTDSKRNEIAIQEASHMLRTVLDTIPSRVFWKDTHSIYLGCNRAFLQHVSLDSDEQVIGKSDHELPLAKQAEQYRQMDRQVIESGTPVLALEVAFAREDGSHGWASVNKIPLRDGDGNIVGVLGVFDDITEMKRLGEERARLQEKLYQQERLASLGLLSAGITHEIGNPNHIITVNSRLMQDVWRDAKVVLDSYYREHGDFSLGGSPYSEMAATVAGLLASVGENAGRIKTTISNMKALFLSQSTPIQQPVDLREAVRDAVRFLQDKIKQHSRRFNTRWEPRAYRVLGNPEQLFQVFVNLIMNALYSLPNVECGVDVILSQEAERGGIRVEVRDEGHGIAPEHLSRIGEPFFTTHQEQGGMGVGLSIAKKIVAQHKGTVTISSEPGGGTQITLDFPEWKHDTT
ncbi:MAG: PAS domain-containing protein [Magnetococcus sp. YQC-3]